MHHVSREACNEKGILGRLDPRVKLISGLVLLAMVVSSRTCSFPLLTAVLASAAIIRLGVPLRELLHRFLEPCLLILVVILFKLFLGGKEELFTMAIGGIRITGYADGLRDGLVIASRMAGAVSVVSLVALTTPFTELMAALAWLRVPRTLVEVSLFAWRYLFVLFDDATVLYNAQRNRLGYTGYRRGFRSLGTLTGALIIKAFDNSQTITTAMHQRGYDGTMPLMRHRPFQAGEVLGSLLILVCMAALWRGL